MIQTNSSCSASRAQGDTPRCSEFETKRESSAVMNNSLFSVLESKHTPPVLWNSSEAGPMNQPRLRPKDTLFSREWLSNFVVESPSSSNLDFCEPKINENVSETSKVLGVVIQGGPEKLKSDKGYAFGSQTTSETCLTLSQSTPSIFAMPSEMSLMMKDAPPQEVFSTGNQDIESVHSDVTGLTGLFVEKETSSIRKQFTTTRGLNASSMRQADVNRSNQKKSVRFHKVSMRSYQRILSVNPSCSSGPPVGLGWKYSQESHYLIDAFEHHREGNRRSKSKLMLSRKHRESMLEGLGYDRRDLAQAVRQTIKVKNQRKRTVVNLGCAAFEEKLESARNGVKNIFIGTHR